MSRTQSQGRSIHSLNAPPLALSSGLPTQTNSATVVDTLDGISRYPDICVLIVCTVGTCCVCAFARADGTVPRASLDYVRQKLLATRCPQDMNERGHHSAPAALTLVQSFIGLGDAAR